MHVPGLLHRTLLNSLLLRALRCFIIYIVALFSEQIAYFTQITYFIIKISICKCPSHYCNMEKNAFVVLAFKGIVHPKMKILSSFTHPQVVPNLYECLCSAEHKAKIFWRMWENRAVLGHHWLPQYFFSYYGSQWCPKTAWLQTFFKISSFVFSRRVSKSWQNFNFWVNYPFNYLNNLFRFLRWLQNCICTEIKLKCLYSNENSFKIIKERKYQTHLIMFFFFSRFIFCHFHLY